MTAINENAVPVKAELLSPAGDRTCLRAAIENGADAVYLGLEKGWNARARATNFSLEELPDVMSELHGRGVLGYVTFNTLVFTDELADAEKTLICLYESGVDAVLIQDLGLAYLAQQVCPDLAVHASTQMTLTSAECIEMAERLGIRRAVLAREISIAEIARISAATDMELEAFVHGALCVAYSGQCLTSESLGGRSANRGQCAQACRLPYDLISDGEQVALGDVKYLLSPQDLAAFDLIPAMLQAGISSFKIEGRLKTAEYVANITRHYRRALDDALRGAVTAFTRQDAEEMELSFSRGFSPGWLEGCDHKMLVPGTSSAKRGVSIGQVSAVRGNRVELELTARIKAGDGVAFSGNRELSVKQVGAEQGGRIFAIYRDGQPVSEPVEDGLVELRIFDDRVNLSEVFVGQEVWKTDDPALNKRLRKSFEGRPKRKIPLTIHACATTGEPLKITVNATGLTPWHGISAEPLPEAEKHVVDTEYLRSQLGRLGNSVFVLRDLTLEVSGRPMAPASLLGKLRHAMLAALETQLKDIEVRRPARPHLESLRQAANATVTNAADVAAPPTLRVLCRSLEQLDVLLGLDIAEVLVDFADIRQYRDATARAAEAGKSLFLATPRIQKPGEIGIFRALLRHEGVGILVRNLAGLKFFTDQNRIVDADFSLNASNDITVQLLNQWSARRVTASYDLNREQLTELTTECHPEVLEVVLHQHMPMFHMEHCVFCAVLSPGTNKTNCGRPCDDHVVELKDRVGKQHPLTADVGCRNTLFNATPQSAAEAVPRLLELGIRHYRLELLWDDAASIKRIYRLYRSLLDQEIPASDVWRALNASNRVGVTRGTLEERRDPLALL
jgi:putative protease